VTPRPSRPTPWLAVLGLAALLLVAPASHAAQRVTLSLENATLHQTLLKLRDLLGWDINADNGAGHDGFRDPDDAPRHTFQWSDASVGQVFRELATAFQMTPIQSGATSIWFRRGATPERLTPSVVRDGVSISLTGLDQRELRALEIGAEQPEVARQLYATLKVRALDGDPDVISGIAELRAVDDLGHALESRQGGSLTPRYPQAVGGWPDEWQVKILLGEFHPDAKRLQRIEGAVVLYRSLRHERVEVPLPLQAEQSELKALGVTIRVVEAQLPTAPNENDPPRRRGQRSSAEIKLEVEWPQELEISTPVNPYDNSVAPWIRLKSGRLWRTYGSNNSTEATPNGTLKSEQTFQANGITEEAVALVWDLETRQDPAKMVRFEFTDVPLPFALPVPPPMLPAAADAAEGRRQPFFDANGGTLVTQVRDGDLPLGPGELSLGLAERAGAGFGPVRWIAIEADAAGVARLEHVAPGVYRIHRQFRPRDELGNLLPLSGTWESASVTVTVAAAKELTLPPLRRTAE